MLYRRIPTIDLGPRIGFRCRPIDQPRGPGDPLLLPCEPTFEPCDNVDNDGNGFLGSHCPTVRCWSDGDCTYGGLLPDADCNFHGDPYPVCNQIDGGSLDLDGKPLVDATACQGLLCPPGLKCVAGDCMTPGTLPPGAECFHGSQCPINSGCIPDDFQNYETATCKTLCQDSACPSGTWCAWETWTSQGQTYQQADCVDAYGCRAGMAQCADLISDCTRNLDCAFAGCVDTVCDGLQNDSCVLQCAEEHRHDSLGGGAASCILAACP
jgi:hypothetical protein